MKLPEWAHYCERCGTRMRRRVHGATPSRRGHLGDALQPSEPNQVDATLQDQNLEDAQAVARGDSGAPAFTVNDAIKQELDSLVEPVAFDDLGRFAWPTPRELASSPESPNDDADALAMSAIAEDDLDAASATADTLDEALPQTADAADEYAAEDDAPELQATMHEVVAEHPEVGSDLMPAEELEELGQEPGVDSNEQLEADASEPALPTQESQAAEDQLDALVTGIWAEGDSSGAPDDMADLWSSQRFERIDVGEDDFPTETYVPTYHRSVEDQRRIQETYALKKLPAHQKPQRKKLQRIVLTIVGAGVVVLSFVLTYPVLNWAMQDNRPALQETSEEPVHYVSKRRAKKIVRSLEGWWTTNRTFDGRYWRIKDGVLETYAADGNLTKKKKIKVDEIELASDALEGVEGKGYYLHGIDFYLSDADPNTLHAINSEGEPDKEANLIRTDEPSFAKSK